MESSEDTAERLNAALAGRYRIEKEIGSGGMATVYLGEDFKHHRNVAIKVLRPDLSAVVGTDRFLAEIATTANLQHPNILPLFDSGEADGLLFYVMPFVEGESLRDRLDRERQLPVEEALHITSDIAEALAAAHEQGVIHRDIKPANILLSRGKALVADFGIALAVRVAGGGRLTETGLSLGTPHYMSPEQASADRDPDGRTDIYSLGCVAYEALVGQPLFNAPSAQGIVSKILTESPTLIGVDRPNVPPNVEAAVHKALSKLPADRFRTARQFADALADPTFTIPGLRSGMALSDSTKAFWKTLSVGLATLAFVLTGLLFWALTRSPPSDPVSRYSVAFPEAEALYSTPELFTSRLAITPDGSYVVYVGSGEMGSQLWLRPRDELRAIPLPGTEGAKNPFVSPDGSRIGFLTGTPRHLKTIPSGGGPSVTLADFGIDEGGGSWGADGYIYLDGRFEGNGLARIPASGGPLEPVTVLDSVRGELWHWFPDALPNGKGVLFTASRGNIEGSSIAVVDLASGSHEVLSPGVRALYASSGHILFVTHEGRLMVAPFDQETLRIAGEAVAVAEGVGVRSRVPTEGTVDIAVSATGTLIYTTGGQVTREGRLEWIDRNGRVVEVDSAWVAEFGSVALSPDGSRVAASVASSVGQHIWVKDFGSGMPMRLTFEGALNAGPSWTPDGQFIAFVSDRGGSRDLFQKRADGSGAASLLWNDERPLDGVVYSSDGEWMVYRVGAGGGRDLFSGRVGEAGPSEALVFSEFEEEAPALSPDGRWLAYVSNESGQAEVYVQPFPEAGTGKWMISDGGGSFPTWSHDGSELFFRSASDSIAAVRVSATHAFDILGRRTLFQVTPQHSGPFGISPDNQRFLMVQSEQVPVDEVELIVVENFFEELRRAFNR
jgi:serine/threonine-protein kinase